MVERVLKSDLFKNYFSYLNFREKGLNKQSKDCMKDFIRDLKGMNKSDRQFFIDWVYRQAFEKDNYGSFLPWNLVHEIIKPELNNWMKEEPENVIPYIWSFDSVLLKKALELQPQNQIAIELLAKRVMGIISMNQHELNSGFGYNGDPEDDLKWIDFLWNYVYNLKDELKKEKITKNLQTLQIEALKYIE
jgi:hypothetical protein